MNSISYWNVFPISFICILKELKGRNWSLWRKIYLVTKNQQWVDGTYMPLVYFKVTHYLSNPKCAQILPYNKKIRYRTKILEATPCMICCGLKFCRIIDTYWIELWVITISQPAMPFWETWDNFASERVGFHLKLL